MYIEENSDLAATLKDYYHLIRSLTPHNEEYRYVNVFRKMNQFLKPYQGRFKKDGKINEEYRFYNEREWRYIPKGDYTRFISESHYSSLETKYKIHLHFDFKDLKFVLVKDKKDVDMLSDFLAGTEFNGEVLPIDSAKLMK